MSTQAHLGLSNFISNEFFFGKKEEKVIKEEEPNIWNWMSKNVDKYELKPTVKFKDEIITLRGNTASMFLRNGKEIDHVAREFKQDFDIYQSLFNSNKSKLAEFGKAQKALYRDLDAIANSETTYEQLKAVLLKHKDSAIKFSPPNNICSKFSYPKSYMLGDFPGYFNKETTHFNTEQKPKEVETVELHSMSDKDKKDIVKLAVDILMFETDIEFFDDEKIGLCWDMTDSPTRGFMDELDKDKEAMSILRPFIEHGMTSEELNAGIIDILKKRVGFLSKGIWGYIRASVK